MVLKCDWSGEKLDQINDQHSQQFAAKFAHLSPSRINCGLRSLRRALNLAFEWGKLERPAKVTLAKGERQRDRVLTMPNGSSTSLNVPSRGKTLQLSTVAQGCALARSSRFDGKVCI